MFMLSQSRHMSPFDMWDQTPAFLMANHQVPNRDWLDHSSLAELMQAYPDDEISETHK
jgi:hypothetical protein